MYVHVFLSVLQLIVAIIYKAIYKDRNHIATCSYTCYVDIAIYLRVLYINFVIMSENSIIIQLQF